MKEARHERSRVRFLYDIFIVGKSIQAAWAGGCQGPGGWEENAEQIA